MDTSAAGWWNIDMHKHNRMGAAIEDRGAEIILIYGGKSRDVHFPHYKHQIALDNCDICHNLFPKKLGV